MPACTHCHRPEDVNHGLMPSFRLTNSLCRVRWRQAGPVLDHRLREGFGRERQSREVSNQCRTALHHGSCVTGSPKPFVLVSQPNAVNVNRIARHGGSLCRALAVPANLRPFPPIISMHHLDSMYPACHVRCYCHGADPGWAPRSPLSAFLLPDERLHHWYGT